MANVLVTGGAGYVGSVCSAQLLERGHNVIVLDDLSSGHAEAVPKGATLYQLDYGERAAVAGLLRRSRIDAVFHFAAKAAIPESVSNPGLFFAVNVASAITFLETLREFGIKKFVFSSSAAVYGNPERIPIEEDHSKDPINSYGETKLMLERALQWYTTAYGWSVIAFRYFNAAGATEWSGEDHWPETHIIPLLLQTAAGERSHFEIYGDDYSTPDGTCIRDYVHVSDIAAAHLVALDEPAVAGMKAYNIGSGHGYSVRELVRVAEEVTATRIRLRNSPRRDGDPAVLCASPAKLRRDFGWKPLHSDLRQIVSSAWAWQRRRLRKLVA
jgi:UDP-glucose 4-epimerase